MCVCVWNDNGIDACKLCLIILHIKYIIKYHLLNVTMQK